MERTAKAEGSQVIHCPSRSLSIFNSFNWKDYTVGIVSSFGLFIQSQIINQIPLINIHPSLLPKWRGPAPIQFTILHGNQTTGVSIIDLHPKLMDAGSIILQETFEIPNYSQITFKSLEESLAEVGGRLAAQVIGDFKNYWTNKNDQVSLLNVEELSHSRKITKADGIISFKTNTFEEISCKVRAFSHQIPIRSVDLFNKQNQLQLSERPSEQRKVFLEDFDFNIKIDSPPNSKLDIWYDRTLKAVLFRVSSYSDFDKFKIIGVRRFKIEGKSQIYSAGSFYSNYLKPMYSSM